MKKENNHNFSIEKNNNEVEIYRYTLLKPVQTDNHALKSLP